MVILFSHVFTHYDHKYSWIMIHLISCLPVMLGSQDYGATGTIRGQLTTFKTSSLQAFQSLLYCLVVWIVDWEENQQFVHVCSRVTPACCLGQWSWSVWTQATANYIGFSTDIPWCVSRRSGVFLSVILHSLHHISYWRRLHFQVPLCASFGGLADLSKKPYQTHSGHTTWFP